MKPDLHLSLEQITGILARRGGFEIGLIEKCERLWAKPLRDFDAGDIRVMLGQKFEPEILVPMALARLEQEPLLEATYYEGDLLGAVLDQEIEYWRQALEEVQRLRSVLQSAKARLEAENFEDIGEIDVKIAEFEERMGF